MDDTSIQQLEDISLSRTNDQALSENDPEVKKLFNSIVGSSHKIKNDSPTGEHEVTDQPDDENTTLCVICCDTLSDPEAGPISMLPCTHCFHEICIRKWDKSCPLCKGTMDGKHILRMMIWDTNKSKDVPPLIDAKAEEIFLSTRLLSNTKVKDGDIDCVEGGVPLNSVTDKTSMNQLLAYKRNTLVNSINEDYMLKTVEWEKEFLRILSTPTASCSTDNRIYGNFDISSRDMFSDSINEANTVVSGSNKYLETFPSLSDFLEGSLDKLTLITKLEATKKGISEYIRLLSLAKSSLSASVQRREQTIAIHDDKAKKVENLKEKEVISKINLQKVTGQVHAKMNRMGNSIASGTTKEINSRKRRDMLISTVGGLSHGDPTTVNPTTQPLTTELSNDEHQTIITHQLLNRRPSEIVRFCIERIKAVAQLSLEKKGLTRYNSDASVLSDASNTSDIFLVTNREVGSNCPSTYHIETIVDELGEMIDEFISMVLRKCRKTRAVGQQGNNPKRRLQISRVLDEKGKKCRRPPRKSSVNMNQPPSCNARTYVDNDIAIELQRDSFFPVKRMKH